MTQTNEQSNRGVALLPGEERRRSQRVIIRVPVTLVVTENGQTLRIPAHTVGGEHSWRDGHVPALV